MKKILLLLGISLIFNCSFWSQCPPVASDEITGGNVNVSISTSQLMWMNTETQSANHEFPAGSGKHVFFAGGMWIGGLDESQVLHFAATRYNNTGVDYFSGPLSTDGSITPTSCTEYDQFFEITRYQAFLHRTYFDATQQGIENELFPNGYEIPEEFYNYPGQGVSELNEAQYLAPYHDFNGDGNYNPEDGDYPDFEIFNEHECPSCYTLNGDVVKFWINNDSGLHTESQGNSLGIEIHNQAFTFNNTVGTLAENSTFYKKRIINRSNNNYHNVYIGIYADADIGNPTDDYVGCNVERNLGYAYNGDTYDESTASATGYGNNIPAAGIVILKGPLAHPDDTDNDGDGIVDNETLPMTSFIAYNVSGIGMDDPQIANQYYNYLKGFWKDGTPLSWRGNGHDSNTGIETNFQFPDDYIPDGLDEWSETNEGTPPGDRRFLISMGPFDLAAGESFCIEFATVIGEANGSSTAIEALHENADYLIEQSNNCYYYMHTPIEDMEELVSVDEENQTLGLILWNNDNQMLTVQSKLSGKKYLSIINPLGQLITYESFSGDLTRKTPFQSSGIYVVWITDNHGNIITKKINVK